MSTDDPACRWSNPAPGLHRLDLTAAGRAHVIFVRAPRGGAPAAGWPSLWLLDGDATLPLAPRDAPGIVVALAFPSGAAFDRDRRSEAYTPAPDAEIGASRSGPVHGGAAAFRRSLLGAIRAEVAARWPLDPAATTLFGFSYGGLFACDTLLTAPGSFARFCAASPSLWFSGFQILRRLRAGDEACQAAGAPRPAVMLSAGRYEQHPPAGTPPARRAHLTARAMLDSTAEAAELLLWAGLPVTLVHRPDADHHAMLAQGVQAAALACFGDAFAFSPPRRGL
ncbi:alpha/beta hydrolase-fold protein [Frigidibacter sp. MR17.14]|uniref:alpha/beta hydrolase n=1 Tax=Frigidibacter sp. MR17.14 TaxID=3126509 RepID=UPI0030131391